jgi:class 3 adenylate cyclase
MATVAFVDIRSFPMFADTATAREVAAYLTAFFEVAVPVVSAHGGVVNKLLGDGLLTLFGAPVPAADHADRAVAAAGALLDAVAESLDERNQVGIGESVLVTAAARALVDAAELVPRGAIALRGKRRPMRAHGLTPSPRTISGRPRRTTPS